MKTQRKKRKKKTKRGEGHDTPCALCRSADISHVGSLKLKFSIEDVFFSKEKIKKKKGKKRIEVIHGFRQTDKATSVGRPTSLMFDIK